MGRSCAEATKALVSRMLRAVGLVAYFGLRRFAAARLDLPADLARVAEVFFDLEAGFATLKAGFCFVAAAGCAGTRSGRAIARARPHAPASRTLALTLKRTSLPCISLLKMPTLQL
jgi:hypothetical protein